MTAFLTPVAAAAQAHVLAAGGLFATGLNLLQTALVAIVLLVGGAAAVVMIFAERKTSKGIITLILIVWICDVISQPAFYQGIIHSVATKIFG